MKRGPKVEPLFIPTKYRSKKISGPTVVARSIF